MNAFFAEFFGTAIIIVFGGGVVANVLLDKTKVILIIELTLKAPLKKGSEIIPNHQPRLLLL